MNPTASSHLYRRITRLRWQAPLFAFLLVLAHQVIEHTVLLKLPPWQHFISQMLFYGLIGPLLAFWALSSLRRSVVETGKAERALQQAHEELRQVNEHLACLLRVNRRLTEAGGEDLLLKTILELPLEAVPALGCSLIRFDERQQPLPALHHGELDTAVLDSWAALLTHNRIKEQCADCAAHSTQAAHACSLLQAAPDALGAGQVYCLDLSRNGRRYAILNVYLSPDYTLNPQEQELLEAMSQEMCLALANHDLQLRELEMLTWLQQTEHLDDLNDELHDMLNHTVAALEAKGGVLFVNEASSGELHPLAAAGAPLNEALPLVKGLAHGVEQTDSPLIIHALEQEEQENVRSLMIAPLRANQQMIGSLVLWADRDDCFTRRRTQLISIVAGQAALLLENQHLYRQGEYRVALAERARLAREIHDGLAQTLGYLKLRSAQISGWLQSGETERAEAGLEEIRHFLHEAYVDAREAIDGLRLQSGLTNTAAWVDEIVAEFEALSGIPVETAVPPAIALPPEIQIQLQRIIQEAFSNIRKHAQATRAWLLWQLETDWLTLQIQD
ncbi:MAG TPA: GAF domain-containing protein, partial [Chloroflexi bacterium]|nr:GAF domain-containing protein [Chloroflexota bacterium]